ncbi:UNVERIFIED_CONTAM: methylglyoxal reductase (NADPH-dependent) gre2 [Siphonaria sp. JEL0065]|nr:methylglyoxal reductase (NADPH-dependent) gre2 [Siphonaria sp. JEL0065]
MSTKLALVSGISGFIGAHVARELLEQGFIVRGTVRSQEKADQVRELLAPYIKNHLEQPDQSSSLEFAIVKDISEPGAFDQAVVGVDYVLHVASPFHTNTNDPEKDLIIPAVQGTVGILKSVDQFGKSVKRVVVTSSVAAIRTDNLSDPRGRSEKDWNEGAINLYNRLKEGTPGTIAYPASKTLAERAAWDFVKESPRSFDLVVVNPPLVLGPTIHPVENLDALNTSVKLVYDLYSFKIKEVNPLVAGGFVDVRDLARAHVLAAVNPKAGGERFLTSGGPWSQELLVKVLAEKYPGRPYATGTSDTPVPELNTKSKEVLGVGEYISFEQSVVDTVKSLQQRFGV